MPFPPPAPPSPSVTEDLNRLAAQDVVYLTRFWEGFGGLVTQPPREVFRGRLRQDLGGGWVFTASTGQNGVVGFVLGIPNQNWSSSESPAAGLQIGIALPLSVPGPLGPTVVANEIIFLTSVIPTEFTD